MNKEMIEACDKLIVYLVKTKNQEALRLFNLFLAEISKSLNNLKKND